MVLGAYGQEFPTKPVRLTTAAAGGGVDFATRLIAQGIAGPLGQPVVVDNRANGTLASDVVAKAAPDGHTLLVLGSALWLTPLLQTTTYDTFADFTPVTLTASAPNLLVLHPSVPVKTVTAFIALARSRPGALNYATNTTGSASHLAAELFKSMAGVNILRVPYKGAAAAQNDLMAGEVQVMFSTITAAGPHVKTGRLKALAVTSAQRSALAPDLPAVAASLPGYESSAMYAMFAPARTPAAIVNRLHQETVRVLSRPDVKEKFLAMGAEVVGSSPEQLMTTVRSETSRLGKVIKDAGIRGD